MRTLNFNNTIVEIEDPSDNFQVDKELTGVRIKYDSQQKTFYLHLKADSPAKLKGKTKVDIFTCKDYNLHGTYGADGHLRVGINLSLKDALEKNRDDMRVALLDAYEQTMDYAERLDKVAS